MEKDLYLSYHLAEIDRTLVLEGDGFTIWAYLLQEDDETVDFEGFLCSTGALVETAEEVSRYIQEGNQPPLMREFANEFSIVEKVTAEDIEVETLDADTVIVLLKGEEYLLMDVAEKQSYSIAVSQDGPYGHMLETEEEDEDEEDEEEL